jgi:hypothetical protein
MLGGLELICCGLILGVLAIIFILWFIKNPSEAMETIGSGMCCGIIVLGGLILCIIVAAWIFIGMLSGEFGGPVSF